jgi:mannitol operon transcriptional antiterminator
LVSDELSKNIEEVILRVSSVVGSSDEMARLLANDLQAREEKGGTFITGHSFVLLHCRTVAVKTLCFGAVKIENKIIAVNGKKQSEAIKLGIIMIAPQNASKNAMETISYLSAMLIERPEFIRVLCQGIEQAAAVEVSNILEEFYRSKHNILMGE